MSVVSSSSSLLSSSDVSSLPNASSYRSCLKSSICAILSESGFSTVESGYILDVLVEMLQSLLYELGRSSRSFGDLACRSQPLPADVVMAMVEMGFTLGGLKEYAFRIGRKTLGNPIPAQPPKPTSILHTGDRSKRVKTHFIPDYFPELPDSHSFVRTATHKQPVTDYESVREKASSQKRDVERALTRFIAKTGKTHSLFKTDDTNLYPLISCDRSLTPECPDLPPYLNALLFKDQIFEEDEREFLPKKRVEKHDEDEGPPIKEEEEEESKDKGKDPDDSDDNLSSPPPPPTPVKKETKPSPREKADLESLNNNPYMRLLKNPRPIAKYKKVPPS